MKLVSDDASDSYAIEVARLLWPEPWSQPRLTRDRHRPGQAHRDAYVFPSRRRPRLMVPADLPAAASMLQRLGNGRHPLASPMRTLLERSVHSRSFGLTRWPMLRVAAPEAGSGESIESYLSACLGTNVRVGVILGTRRPNQKPVLQAFDLEGQLLGYVKVGHNELTGALVRREGESLAIVNGHAPRTFRAPRLIHHGQWAGLEILVISPLATDPRTPVPRQDRLAAMQELVQLAGNTTARLGSSVFWAKQVRSVEQLSGHPDGGRLRAAAVGIEERHAADPLTLGGWHGDWGHWNMGMSEGVLQVWDWERYDPQVPIGFDGLHFAAQNVRPGRPDARGTKEEMFLQSAPEALAELGVDPDQHDLTLRLYLLEMALRYVDALTHGATPALERRTAWVLSLLEQLCPQPRAALPEGRP